jgi:hypothetical protein
MVASAGEGGLVTVSSSAGRVELEHLR